MRCPACHDEMLEGEPVAACRDRHVLLHADCRELVRGFCPTTGCGSRLIEQGAFSADQDKGSDRIQMTPESVARANQPTPTLQQALDGLSRLNPAGATFGGRPIEEVGAELRDHGVGWVRRNAAIAATLLIGLLGCGVIAAVGRDPDYWPVGMQVSHAIESADTGRLRRIASRHEGDTRERALDGLEALAQGGHLRSPTSYLNSPDPRLVEIGIRALDRNWERGVPSVEARQLLELYGQTDDAAVEAAAVSVMDRYSHSMQRALKTILSGENDTGLSGFRKRLGDGHGEVFAFLLETLRESDKRGATKIRGLIRELPEAGLPALFEALGSGRAYARDQAFAELKRRHREVTEERLVAALRPDQELRRRCRTLELLGEMRHLPDFVVAELSRAFCAGNRLTRTSAKQAARRLADDDVILGKLLAIAAGVRSREALMTGKALRELAPRIEDPLVGQALTDGSAAALFATKLLLDRPTGRHALTMVTLGAEGETRTRGLKRLLARPEARKELFEVARKLGQSERVQLETIAILPPTTRTVDLLSDTVLSGSRSAAERALKRIAEINPARGEFQLASAIPRSRDLEVKRRALAGVVALGFTNAVAIESVKGLVFDRRLGREAAEALGRQGPAGRAALVSIVEEGVARKRGNVSLAKHCESMVVHGLKSAGPAGEEALARLLTSPAGVRGGMLGAVGRDSSRSEALDQKLVDMALAGGKMSSKALFLLVAKPSPKVVERLLEPIVDGVPGRAQRAEGILSRMRSERLAPCLLKLTFASRVKAEAERRLEVLISESRQRHSLAFVLVRALDGADRAAGVALARRLQRHDLGVRIFSYGRSSTFPASAGVVACLLELDSEDTLHRLRRELASTLGAVRRSSGLTHRHGTWQQRGEDLIKVLAADFELAIPLIDQILADSAKGKAEGKAKASFPKTMAEGVARVLAPRSRKELERWQEPLLDCIESGDAEVARNLAPIAARFGHAASLRITAALRGESRAAALEAAAALEPAPPLDMLPRLLEGLESKDQAEVAPAALAVGRVVATHLGGAGSLPAARSLRELVAAVGRMPQRGGLTRVVEGLDVAGIGKTPGRLFDLASDERVEVRIGVARTISLLAMAQTEAQRTLESLARDKDRAVRSAAAGALRIRRRAGR